MTALADLQTATTNITNAVASLDTTVDSLITLTNKVAADLAALQAAQGDTVAAADVANVVAQLQAGAVAAADEQAKAMALLTPPAPAA